MKTSSLHFLKSISDSSSPFFHDFVARFPSVDVRSASLPRQLHLLCIQIELEVVSVEVGKLVKKSSEQGKNHMKIEAQSKNSVLTNTTRNVKYLVKKCWQQKYGDLSLYRRVARL